MSDELSLPDPALVCDEIFNSGMDALMNEPMLADVRKKLSEQELQKIVAVVTHGTAAIMATLLLNALGAAK